MPIEPAKSTTMAVTGSAAPGVLNAGKRRFGLPAQIIAGAVLGALMGICLGDRAAVLEPIGSAYAKLLQIAVFPYLLCSLLHGLGRLTPATAGRLLAASWRPFLFLWGVTFAAIWLLGRAIPAPSAPTVIVAAPAAGKADLLELLIPSNPFAALDQNYVPAIVLFAIVYGIAFQGIAQKQTLLDLFDAVKVASVKIWGWIVFLAPFGVFALFASTAGTVQPDRLGGLVLYLGLYLAGTLILAFLVLPMALAALVPVGYRGILRELQPALVLAAVTTLSVVALPFVQRSAELFARRAGCPDGEEQSSVLQTSLALSYVFAQLGNYFVYLLMIYAAYASDTPLGLSQRLFLPVMTLLSCVGSPSATYDSVVFLGNWLALPGSVLELYVETSTITRYGQVILSVMGFAFITTATPLLYFRKARLRPARAALGLAGGATLLGAIAFLGFVARPALFPRGEIRLLASTLDPRLVAQVTVRLLPPAPEVAVAPSQQPDPSIGGIRTRGRLRVGYNPNVIPFSYRNARQELVGFDIAYAYRLASDLKVGLELIPFEWDMLVRDLTEARFDIAMSGIYATDDRLQALSLSRPYYESPVAIIVRSERADEFREADSIAAMTGLRLAVFDDPVLLPLARNLFPDARIEVVPNYDGLPDMTGRVDGAIWTLQQAAAWAGSHPGFTAVAPSHLSGPIPIVYVMPPGAKELRDYVEQWLDLRRADGFRRRELDYWMLGRPREDRRPRWNLLDAVLHGS